MSSPFTTSPGVQKQVRRCIKRSIPVGLVITFIMVCCSDSIVLSIITGMASFFIICFAQCIYFKIPLTPSTHSTDEFYEHWSTNPNNPNSISYHD